MKKKGRVWSKLLVLFVALAMVFGTVSTAFAAGPTKTATATNIPGEYKITLSTSGDTTSIPVQTSRDYVIIIDVSSSMSGTNIDTVKAVMTGTNGFVNQVFKKTGTTRVNVVTFGNDAYDSGWLTNSTAANKAITDITIPYNIGTDYQAGLEKAATVLESSNAAEKYVIFLSDGKPTQSSNYDGLNVCTEGVWNETVTAIDTFNTAAATDKVTAVYPIAFNTDPSVSLTTRGTWHWISYNNGYYTYTDWSQYGHTVTFTNDNYTDLKLGKTGKGSYNFMEQLSPGNVKTATTDNLAAIIAAIIDQMNYFNMTDAVIYDPINTEYFIPAGTSLYADNDFDVYKKNSAGVRTDLTKGTDYSIDESSPSSGIKITMLQGKELTSDETLYVEFNVKISNSGYEKIFKDGNTTIATNLAGNPTGAYTDGTINGTQTDKFWYASPEVTVPTATTTLTKTDKDTNASLTGAQFTLTRQGGDSPSRTISFDDKSSMTIANLPMGTYTLTETTAPDGYQADSTAYTIKVDASGAITSISPTEQNLSLGADGSLTFTNAAKMGQLTVSKSVTGNLASTTQDFTFTAAFKDASNNAVASGVYKYVDAEGAEQSLVLGENGSMTFTLHHGQNVVFNLPQGVAYTVTETAVDGYNNTTVNGTETHEATGDIVETAATAAFVNNASSTVPSALTNDTTPFLFMAAGIGILGLALVISKRSKTKSGF